MRVTLAALLAFALLGTCVAGVNTAYAPQHSKSLLPLSSPTLGRDTRFAPMRAQCTIFQPPRLITGRPATSTTSTPRTLVVDIIVLNSGHVEDPFIIEGGDPSLDDDVLEMISGWRYRPAMCDGNPIEAEGRIQVRLESSLTTATPKSE